jgi:D-alanyl-D-alanine carboxypeptidase
MQQLDERRGPSGMAARASMAGLIVALLAGACSPVAPTAKTTPALTTGASASEPGVTPTPTVSATSPTVRLFGKVPAAPSGRVAVRYQAAIEAAVGRGAPDVMAAVISPGGRWAGAAGVGGLDARKVTAEDEYYLGSITQIFTAALTMRLAEQGKIDLDAPLSTYLGDLAVDTNGATVRQALGMRSGIPDLGESAGEMIRAEPGRPWTLQEVIGHFLPATAAAGSAYIPAGPNYTLLAAASEHVTGTTFGEALRTSVLDPVHAPRIVQQATGVRTPKPWALPTAGHFAPLQPADYGADGVISFLSSVTFSYGYGSMASDAPSLARWVWQLFNGEVVSEDSLRQMLPPSDEYGHGLMRISGVDSAAAIGQIGSKTGYSAMLVVYPEERVVVVMFVNDLEFVMEPTIIQLRDIALGR